MLLLAVTLVAAAATETPSQVLERVSSSYRKGGDFSASFTQTYFDKLRNRRKVESGRIWVKRDGRVRWTYEKPERKDFVYDGKAAYFYEPESAQVSVFEHFESAPLANALRFLWGQGKPTETFGAKTCTEAECKLGEAADRVVRLVPKKEIASVDHIVLSVKVPEYLVRRSIVFDPLGNSTTYEFAELKFGAAISDSVFAFEIPKGVSVLKPATDGSGSKP